MNDGFFAGVRLGPAWHRASADDRSVVLRYDVDGTPDGAVVSVGARRSVDGWLRDAYPVSLDDVELFAVEESGSQGLSLALAELAQCILTADRHCRRVVFAATAGNEAVLSAAQAAGFRYVLDVDVRGAELSLLVAEPRWVMTSDANLDEVPEN